MEISNTPEGLLRSSHTRSPSRVDTAPCDIARVPKGNKKHNKVSVRSEFSTNPSSFAVLRRPGGDFKIV